MLCWKQKGHVNWNKQLLLKINYKSIDDVTESNNNRLERDLL